MITTVGRRLGSILLPALLPLPAARSRGGDDGTFLSTDGPRRRPRLRLGLRMALSWGAVLGTLVAPDSAAAADTTPASVTATSTTILTPITGVLPPTPTTAPRPQATTTSTTIYRDPVADAGDTVTSETVPPVTSIPPSTVVAPIGPPVDPTPAIQGRTATTTVEYPFPPTTAPAGGSPARRDIQPASVAGPAIEESGDVPVTTTIARSTTTASGLAAPAPARGPVGGAPAVGAGTSWVWAVLLGLGSVLVAMWPRVRTRRHGGRH